MAPWNSTNHAQPYPVKHQEMERVVSAVLCKLFKESMVFVDTSLFELPVKACWESVLCEIGQDEPELELEYRSAAYSI